MPFQESARTWRSKAHISAVKPSVLVVVSIVMVVILFLVLQNIWTHLHSSGFEIYSSDEVAVSEAVEEDLSVSEEKVNVLAEPLLIYVHIGGAVNDPGVYSLEEGSRLQAVIEAAGGFCDDAARDSVNLARIVNDGEQIIVATEEEFASGVAGSLGEAALSGSSGRVNINTASLNELITLPGIGEATAQKIISEREASGPFSSPEDIMRVSGIGEKKYAALAENICV